MAVGWSVVAAASALRNARAVLGHYEELWRGRVDRMRDLLDEDDLPSRPPDQESSQ